MSLIPSGAQVYGVSLASMQLPHGRAIARELRTREPDALLVCGGSHASAVPDECADPVVMQGGQFDVVVEREGESAFLDVVNAVENGWNCRRGDIILDRMSADSDWRYARAPCGHEQPPARVIRGQPVEPLDSLPFPARDMLDFSRYTRKVAGLPATNIITTRGCPARCTFCQQESLWGPGLRMMSAPRILAEVDHIKSTTGIGNLLFLDDSLTARKRADMTELCAGLKARGVLWRGWTRANLVTRPGDAEMLRTMANAGCQALCIGVEAGSDSVLRALDKGTTVETNRRAIRAVAESGMQCRISIMVGNPGETWADVMALVRFVAELGPYVEDWILSSYVPLPGSPAWDDPERYGMFIDKEEARRSGYAHFFVVGGQERSPTVHRYADGTGPDEIRARHDFVQENLLRLAPRDRRGVVAGRA